MNTAISRHMSWHIKQDGTYCFSYQCGDKRWNRSCHMGQRRELLLSVGNDAANPNLSLDWDDAAYITSRIREIVPNKLGWTTVEAQPATEQTYHKTSRWTWFGLAMSVAFWAAVFYSICIYLGNWKL